MVGIVGDATHGVGRRGDESVAVGVDGVPVDPVALVVDQPVGVEFAGRDDIVAQGAVAVDVPVDRQLVGKVVEVLALLELSEGRADDRRVEQPDVGGGRAVGRDLLGGGLAVAGVVAVGNHVGGQAIGLPRRGDAAADVFAFLLRGIGFHADLLDDQRPPRTHDQRRQQQQHQADGRNPQVAQHDSGEHGGGADERDRQQDQLRRQYGVDIGVAGTGERLARPGVRQQLVAVQPIGDRLEQHQQADQADQLDPRRAAQRTGAAGEPNAPKDVVPEHVGHEGQEHRHENVAEQQPVERQVEGVEAEVLAELRVPDAEISAMQEQLDPHPVALRDDAGQQADRRRDANSHQPQARHDDGAVPRHRIVGVARDEHRAGAIGQRQTGEDDAADQQTGDQEDQDAGDQHGGEHRAVPELAEPQPVDVGVDQARACEQQNDHTECDQDQNPATPSQLRHPCGGPHPHWLRSLIVHRHRFVWTVTTVRTSHRVVGGLCRTRGGLC